ncbi:WD domain [Trypanosoma vivax]|uniref:Uncharacterized protein n=1 Tax=Trypanosoma vivax (strain Y486) TaxID=1055687 RepID=G0U7V5_TRYVY|nr:hypothetical protein TRVL_00407 [Trypanosoma vivax]KAH8620665.1 WD domain [Trypanosoma vivax]CCC51963.1 conserved hypothetical protein [Trypanosoma vivax Y486]
MDNLVRENARAAREMRGVALLSIPDENEPGWRMRRNTLLRSCYPHLAPPAADVQSSAGGPMGSGAVVVHSGESGVNVQPHSLAPKRTREEHHAVISVHPSVLKSRVEALSTKMEIDNSHTGADSRVPPPSWKMSKVLVGHRGWVWCAAVDPSNSWFATGGGDAVVKVWDLTTGTLKLNLTGHKEGVRSLSLSALSPYMFTGSDDHSIKCWDLERNEIIRDFYGHKGAVHCVSAHPSLDIIASGGRDKTVRVWDVRTRSCVHLLVGHTDSVMSLVVQQGNPQVISGGSDGIIYLWDIIAGRAFTRLTRHKKPVRGLTIGRQGKLVSCGADNIRVWSLTTSEFLFNASTAHGGADDVGQESYRWSCCSISPRNVLAVGSQEGKLALYDGPQSRLPPYQFTKTRSVPGTLPGEGGINCIAFDVSGSRMITGESDKSVKVWRARE